MLSNVHNVIINRGDPSEADFTLDDLIADQQWHDLDLRHIIPEECTAVLIGIKMEAKKFDKAIKLRRRGNVNEVNISMLNSQIANVENYSDFLVVHNSRRIEYWIDDAKWLLSVEISVKGWIV